MAASPKPEPGTTLARTDETPSKAASKYQHIIDDNKARNALVAQIRGTMWGKECNDATVRAVAQYCREMNIDPVRHVEVLGGRIYLTAELYDEKGAELLRSGVIIPKEPDYINADARLDELAKMGDSWAAAEELRRKRERIRWGVPEDAKAAVVQRFEIAQSGQAVVGVNWCGHKSGKKDPVGDAEPTKTAQTRARRRAWKQIADVIPGYAAMVRPIEERARALAPVATVEATDIAPHHARPVIQNGGYEVEPVGEPESDGRQHIRENREILVTETPASVSEVEDELLEEDRELVESEEGPDLGIQDARPRRRSALED